MLCILNALRFYKKGPSGLAVEITPEISAALEEVGINTYTYLSDEETKPNL